MEIRFPIGQIVGCAKTRRATMLGNRGIAQVLRAVAGKQNYVALANMARHYPHFLDAAI
jgi:hypothetical protein